MDFLIFCPISKWNFLVWVLDSTNNKSFYYCIEVFLFFFWHAHIIVPSVCMFLAWQINQIASCEFRLHKDPMRRQCIGIIFFCFVFSFCVLSGVWQCRVAISIVRHSFGSRPEFNETFRRTADGQKVEKQKMLYSTSYQATDCTFLWHGSLF